MRGLEYFLQTFDGGAYNFEQALEFDGVDDFCVMPPITHGALTFSFWFKTNATTGTFLGASTAFRAMRLISNTQIQVNFGANDVFTVPTIVFDTWHHVMLTYSSSISPFGTSLYYDGVQSGTTVLNGGQNFALIDQLGKIQAGSSIFNGVLDDLLIWEGVIGTAQDAIDIYNAGAGVDPTTVIANPNRWYKFNGNQNDSGSDLQNLTINNFIPNPYVTH